MNAHTRSNRCAAISAWRNTRLQSLESNVVRALEAMSGDWGKVRMLERVKNRKKVQLMNPFAKQRH